MHTKNPAHHICPDCFYTWVHGCDGSHSCVQQLRAFKLPAEVRLPGGMLIGKGCNLGTLLTALRRRENGEAWHTSFDVPIPADDRLQQIIRALPAQPLSLLGEPPYSDFRTGEATWSANGEDWHNIESVEDLIRETEPDLCSLEPGSVVYIGTKRYHDPAEFIDLPFLMEHMGDNARQSDAGEWVDGWPNPSEQAKDELKALLDTWARRHCPPDFYLVENTRPYTITVEDMERASQPAGIDSEGGSHD